LCEKLPKSGSLENQISQISTNLFIPELPPLCQEKIGAIALLGQVGEKNAGRKPPMHPRLCVGQSSLLAQQRGFSVILCITRPPGSAATGAG